MTCLHIRADNISEAWEQAVIQTWALGTEFQTEYDKPGDPLSKDATVMMSVTNSQAEPRIHKCQPGGLDDLAKYTMEVLFGVHNHWVDTAAGSTKWKYTYNSRMVDARGGCQIENAIRVLKDTPHSRRVIISMWDVSVDPGSVDPPCVQYLSLRVSPQGKLNMVLHIRSNDAYKAAFMNMYAFTELQKYISCRLGISVGTYVHVADSFHIYGSYFQELNDVFIKLLKKRSFQERTMRSDDPIVMENMMYGINEILNDPAVPEVKKEQVRLWR